MAKVIAGWPGLTRLTLEVRDGLPHRRCGSLGSFPGTLHMTFRKKPLCGRFDERTWPAGFIIWAELTTLMSPPFERPGMCEHCIAEWVARRLGRDNGG